MKSLLVVGAGAVLLAGCAAAPPVQHVRFADAASGRGRIDWNRPIQLEFQAGDRLPIRFQFSDELFELSPAAPPLAFVAKRHGFVRIERGRITSSLTGTDFDVKPRTPGAFRFGLAMTRDGTWVDAAVTTPRRAPPK
jgi:hypothetical protein